MEKNKSLVKSGESFISKICHRIKYYFAKNKKDSDDIVSDQKGPKSSKQVGYSQADFDILRDILNKKAKIGDLDLEVKKRLIKLCKERFASLEKEIDKYDNKLIEKENKLRELKEVNAKI